VLNYVVDKSNLRYKYMYKSTLWLLLALRLISHIGIGAFLGSHQIIVASLVYMDLIVLLSELVKMSPIAPVATGPPGLF
jgi:hypothetical protein